VRGLHPSGYEEVRIFNKKDLIGLNNKKHAIRVAGKLGAKKRISLIDYVQSRGFKVLNVGISQKELASLESMLESSIEDEEYIDTEDLEDLIDED
ncbi:MAG: eL32 family ribosomal protein, partial [Promethearchaeota archaeon]